MTALVEQMADAHGAPAIADATRYELAGWRTRAAALVVDTVPGLVVAATMALVWLAVPPQGLWWWTSLAVLVVAALATIANRAILPAYVGWSLGRALLGVEVVQLDGAAASLARLVLREAAHLLDTLSAFVGWLWPLWDSHNRTFADLLLRTEVRRVEPERRPANIKKHTAVASGATVALCVAGAAVSVFAIFLPERAASQTRNQVSAQGPKIVAQMLTYDPKTLQQDFGRARSLTTDKYRPQLVKQQETVQKGHPVINEYWVTDSTVLSATRNSATMLLFMQGHRGGGDEERFITATVRVSLLKGKDSHWLVDNLDVVTRPRPPAAKQPAPPPAPEEPGKTIEPTPAAPKGHK